MTPFLNLVRAVSTLAGWVAALCIGAAVVITCQMIWVRGVMGGSTIWQTPWVILLVIAATMFGLAWTQAQRGHVNVDLLARLMSARARKPFAVLVYAASFGVIALMAWFSSIEWLKYYDKGWLIDGTYEMKEWAWFLPVPAGLILFALQLFADTLAVATGREKPFGLDDEAALVDVERAH